MKSHQLPKRRKKSHPLLQLLPKRRMKTPNQMSLKKNPFHINCVGCHKEQGAGPAKCDECHPKAE